jgi:hypothetical protein
MKKFLTFTATLVILVTGCSSTNDIKAINDRLDTLEYRQNAIIEQAIPYLHQYNLMLHQRQDSIIKGRI